jgi:hypothetical protein
MGSLATGKVDLMPLARPAFEASLDILPLLEGFFLEVDSHGEITVDFAVLALVPHLH